MSADDSSGYTLYTDVSILLATQNFTEKEDGVSSGSSGLVDVYYSSNGYLVQSANLYPGLIRVTKFRVGNSDDMYDDVDSPLHTSGTWTNNILDTETNYVFLYDHDGHYSKLQIVDMGGGTPGNPAWIGSNLVL